MPQDTARRLVMAVSLKTTRTLGTGTTKNKSISALYYFACEEEDGRVSLCALNHSNLPSGERTYISKDELLCDYLPEPDLYLKAVVPAMRELSRSIARGESHRSRGTVQQRGIRVRKGPHP